MYTYHFCAISNTDFGSIKDMDGVVSKNVKLDNWEEYQRLKGAIAIQYSVRRETVTICSLTLLHQDNDSIDLEKEKQANEALKKFELNHNRKEMI